MKVVCILIQEGKFLKEIAESCYRLTPQVALREDGALFLEIGSCEKIYKEKNLLLRLEALLKRFGVKARIGLGEDPALSLCFARWGRRQVGDLPLEALYDIASPFKKDEFLFKQTAEFISILKKLGIHNIGEFLKLPSKSLSSRFREFGLELYRKVSSPHSHLSWPPFVPPEKIEETLSLQDCDNCQTLEPLLFLIKNIVGRAMARLAGRNERVVRFELKLELEKHSLVKNAQRRWEFTLPLPQGSVLSLLPLIQEKLQTDFQRAPLESWVNHLHFLILETVPGQYGQKNFFNKKEEEQEAWNSLVARLCQKLGKESAFTASLVESFRPEKSWKKDWREIDLTETVSRAPLPFPQRPLRILKEPARLFKIDNFLEGQAKRWEIQDWEGPERLAGEWWDENFKRDYFRIGTKNGEQLWVFRIPNSDKLFLHGYFD